MPKTVGILGGMGPQSTIELMSKILARTPARVEQDHIRLLVDSRPQIPDRTKSILGTGPSPVPMMQDSVKQLAKWGADLLAIPCNTAHHFIDDLQSVVTIPVINMLQLLANRLETNFRPGQSMALLATTGSIKANLFQRYLSKFELLIPESDVQENLVMTAIYGENGIKASGCTAANRTKMLDAIESLASFHPVCVVAGCTEIGNVLEGVTLPIPIFNPLYLLAGEIVEQALSGAN